MKSRIGSALVALAALFGVQSQAAAIGMKVPSPLPPVSGQMLLGACYGGLQMTCSPGGAAAPPAGTTTIHNGVASASGTITLSSSPTISGALFGTNGSFLDVTLQYGFEVVDPFAPVGFTAPVSVQFSSSGEVVGLPADDDYAQLQIFNAADLLRNGFPIFSVTAGTLNSPGNGHTSFSVSTHLTGLNSIYSNTAYVISMEVYLALTSNTLNSGIGYIDPTISIDPGQLDYAGLPDFNLAFSPGVTATPLPASFPLIAGGLGMIGLMGARKRRRTAAA